MLKSQPRGLFKLEKVPSFQSAASLVQNGREKEEEEEDTDSHTEDESESAQQQRPSAAIQPHGDMPALIAEAAFPEDELGSAFKNKKRSLSSPVATPLALQPRRLPQSFNAALGELKREPPQQEKSREKSREKPSEKPQRLGTEPSNESLPVIEDSAPVQVGRARRRKTRQISESPPDALIPEKAHPLTIPREEAEAETIPSSQEIALVHRKKRKFAITADDDDDEEEEAAPHKRSKRTSEEEDTAQFIDLTRKDGREWKPEETPQTLPPSNPIQTEGLRPRGRRPRSVKVTRVPENVTTSDEEYARFLQFNQSPAGTQPAPRSRQLEEDENLARVLQEVSSPVQAPQPPKTQQMLEDEALARSLQAEFYQDHQHSPIQFPQPVQHMPFPWGLGQQIREGFEYFIGSPPGGRRGRVGENRFPPFHGHGRFRYPPHPHIDPIPENPTYEQLLEISEMIGDAKKKGLSKKALKSLPRIKYQPSPDTAAECPICLTGFEENEQVVVLKCVHRFHDTCISTWLGTNSNCPICRVKVD